MPLSITRSAIVLGVAAATITLAIVGCSQSPKSADATTQPTVQSAWWQPRVDDRSGAELWSQTCSHCHNLRSPASYGPHQWDVALYDMRVRANLTGDEQRKILAFMKAASQ